MFGVTSYQLLRCNIPGALAELENDGDTANDAHGQDLQADVQDLPEGGAASHALVHAKLHHHLTFLRVHQISAYGACVMAHKDNIEQGVCEKQFRELQQCFAKSVREQWPVVVRNEDELVVDCSCSMIYM